MLNYIKTHICTNTIIKFFLIFLLTISNCTFDFNSDNKRDRKIKPDVSSINFRITNELSDFPENKYITKQANDFLAQWNLTGMSMAIVKNGKLIYAQGFGYADLDAKLKVSPGHLFRLASISKLITATAIMKMVEMKMLKLDDKVFGPSGIIKDTIFSNVKDKRLYHVTIKQLLAHSGGWSLHYGDPAFNSQLILERIGENGEASLDSYLKFIASRRLHFNPGTRSSYSNMGYMFLSKVIENVSGQSYESFINNEVLRPVGIYDMHIGRSYLVDKRVNEVKYYESDETQYIPAFDGSGRMVPKVYGGNPIELLGPAGGWIASSVELAKLLVLIDGFKSVPDMLPNSYIEQMTENKDFKGPLGWKTIKENGDWVRTGSMAGTSAIMKRQTNGFSWVVLINSSSWKGSKLPAYIEYMMRKIEQKVTSWPEHDLLSFKN